MSQKFPWSTPEGLRICIDVAEKHYVKEKTMDANKLKVLQEIGYKIRHTCGVCEHARIPPTVDFGTCAATTYEHLKHGETRDLSIHRSGHCPLFQWNQKKLTALHGFSALVSYSVETMRDACLSVVMLHPTMGGPILKACREIAEKIRALKP